MAPKQRRRRRHHRVAELHPPLSDHRLDLAPAGDAGAFV
jgi:hypothetical protein